MVIRAWDEPLLKRWMTQARAAGLSRFEAGNIGALQLLEDWKLGDIDLAFDFTLYAMNAEATRFWAERSGRMVTLSVEDDLKNLQTHLARWPWDTGVRPQAILYKDTPLFIAEACSLTALHNGCPTAKVCGYRTLEIESPAGERYYVAHESCKSIVYAKDAYSIAHRRQALEELGVRDFRIDFLTRPYTAERMAEILLTVMRGEAIPATHTANFDRSLL
jgi:putative protease